MYGSDYFWAWVFAFVFTQTVEIPIYRRLIDCSLLRAFGASALTHPIVWFVIFPHWAAPYPIKAAGAELFAWVVEAAYFLPGAGWTRAFGVSLVANASSFGLGLVSRHFFGVP